MLISVTVNGHTLNYSPTVLGFLLLSTTNGTDLFDISTDSSSGLGEGIRGAEISFLLTSAPTFGAPLSPNNPLLFHTSTSYDYLDFYDQSGGTPAETLSFYVTQASQ